MHRPAFASSSVKDDIHKKGSPSLAVLMRSRELEQQVTRFTNEVGMNLVVLKNVYFAIKVVSLLIPFLRGRIKDGH